MIETPSKEQILKDAQLTVTRKLEGKDVATKFQDQMQQMRDEVSESSSEDNRVFM